MVKLTIEVSGSTEVEVDDAEWADAKRNGCVAEFLDSYASDIDTDTEVYEPGGTQIDWASGEVI